MIYGITTTGFVAKRLPDIKSDLETTLRDTFGKGIDLDAESPLGQIVGIFAERESKLWELAEGVFNSGFPDTADGVALDNAVALTGIVRQGQTFSTVSALLFGDAGTFIPSGSIASVAGNASARFRTTTDAVVGASVNEVQKVTFSAVPASGNLTLSFKSQTTSTLAFNASAAAVQTALRALSNISDDLTVTGNFSIGFTVTYAGADGAVNQDALTIGSNTLLTGGAAPVTVAVVTLTPGIPAQVAVNMIAESAGSVAAPAGSLTVIESPIAGWSGITNALDAEVGDEIETDAELRLRRAASMQKAGAGTLEAIRSDLLQLDGVESVLVFENSTLTTDVAGRPAKSFEVVVLGGLDQDIAQTIWDDKPAGIQTYGGQIKSILDSQGFSHDIYFSRPTELNIWLELDLTTTSAFPASGVNQVKAAIIAYGNTLNLGDDVVIYPSLIAALALIPGIINVAVRIGLAAHPVSSSNVTVNAFEIAIFDTSRIGVTIL